MLRACMSRGRPLDFCLHLKLQDFRLTELIGAELMQDKSLDRDTVACRLAEDLIGPRGEDEELSARPSDVYLTGILWPQRTAMSGEDDERLGTAGASSGEESDGESDAVRTGSIQKPSVAGISFSVVASSGIPQVRVSCNFATYRIEKRDDIDIWVRQPHRAEFRFLICRPDLRVRLSWWNTETGCLTSRSVSDASMQVSQLSSHSLS